MSDHPQFTGSLKKTKLKDVQPGAKEGWLMKCGLKYHSWKRRYFVMKDQFIWYFPQNNPNTTPKGVIELNSHSHAETTNGDDSYKHITINSVHRKQQITAETPEIGAQWIDAINNHIKTLKKVEERKKQEEENVIVPFTGLSWPDIKTEINVLKHQNESTIPQKEFTNLLKKLGMETCERYFYNILMECIVNWDDDDIAMYVWEEFGRNLVRMEEVEMKDKLHRRQSIMRTKKGKLYRLLSDINIVFGGTQGVIFDENGKEIEDSDEITLVFGKTAQAGLRIANIYNILIKNNNINFNEVIRTILDAMVKWKVNTEDIFFRNFVNGITADWNCAKVGSLISFLTVFTKEHIEEPFNETPWEDLPPHALSFIKTYTIPWNNEEKVEFIEIGSMLWGWNAESFAKLRREIGV